MTFGEFGSRNKIREMRESRFCYAGSRPEAMTVTATAQIPASRRKAQYPIRSWPSIDRPSASAGERQAAEWVAERLRAHGARAEAETEPCAW